MKKVFGVIGPLAFTTRGARRQRMVNAGRSNPRAPDDPKGPAGKAARRRSLREDAVDLPNLLSAARIVMIPAVLLLLDRGGPHDCYWAAWVYAAAGAITDFFDGSIARRQGLVGVLATSSIRWPTS